MLEGASIVCVSQDWDGAPTSKTHIMRRLARRNRVLWVNSIGMRRPRATAADLRRLARKLRGLATRCREVEPNLLVANPLVLPLPGLGWADRLNASVLAATLRRLCRAHGLGRPILWSFLPNANRLVGRLGERLVVYHCVDDYAEFTGVPKEALRAMERDLVRRADVVFASAEKLCDERRPDNPETHFIPHGVDAAHFGRALDPATAIAEPLRLLPRPVIGYFGLLADWVDLDLVRRVARMRPGWSFVLVGAATTDVGALRGLPNVHLAGPRPYAELPRWCRGFDAAWIPFRINRLTLRVNPLKLREYLAAGLPVASSRLPEVARFGEVRVADGPRGFAAALEECLRDRSATADRARAGSVRAESWDERVERLSGIVERRLAEAGRPGAEERCA